PSVGAKGTPRGTISPVAAGIWNDRAIMPSLGTLVVLVSQSARARTSRGARSKDRRFIRFLRATQVVVVACGAHDTPHRDKLTRCATLLPHGAPAKGDAPPRGVHLAARQDGPPPLNFCL